jgi:hypothetical protein
MSSGSTCGCSGCAPDTGAARNGRRSPSLLGAPWGGIERTIHRAARSSSMVGRHRRSPATARGGIALGATVDDASSVVSGAVDTERFNNPLWVDPWNPDGPKRGGAFRWSYHEEATGDSTPGDFGEVPESEPTASHWVYPCDMDIDGSDTDYETINGQFQLDVRFGDDARELFIFAMEQLKQNTDLIEEFYAQSGVTGSGSDLVNLINGEAGFLVNFKLDRGLCTAYGWTFPGIAKVHINPDYVKALSRAFFDVPCSSSASSFARIKTTGWTSIRVTWGATTSMGLIAFARSESGSPGAFRTGVYEDDTGDSHPGDDPLDDFDRPTGGSGSTSSVGECECVVADLARTLLHEMAHIFLAGEKEAYLLESYWAYRYEGRNSFTHNNCCGHEHTLTSFVPSDYDTEDDVRAGTSGNGFDLVDGIWQITGCQSFS